MHRNIGEETNTHIFTHERHVDAWFHALLPFWVPHHRWERAA